MNEEQYESEQIKLARKRAKIAHGCVQLGILDLLKDKFQTDLPCFQGTAGHYDSLDAMRRDAYREVVLWIEGLNTKHKEQTQND